MNSKDIVRFLQSYKGYLQAFLGYPVLLMYHSNGITHKRGSGSASMDDILIDKSANIPVLPMQYRASIVMRMVEDWLAMLDVEEQEAIFGRYIDHDFQKPRSAWERSVLCERGSMAYKTISYRMMAKRLDKSEMCLRRRIKSGIAKIAEITRE